VGEGAEGGGGAVVASRSLGKGRQQTNDQGNNIRKEENEPNCDKLKTSCAKLLHLEKKQQIGGKGKIRSDSPGGNLGKKGEAPYYGDG